jgi:hypothetical protein
MYPSASEQSTASSLHDLRYELDPIALGLILVHSTRAVRSIVPTYIRIFGECQLLEYMLVSFCHLSQLPLRHVNRHAELGHIGLV